MKFPIFLTVVVLILILFVGYDQRFNRRHVSKDPDDKCPVCHENHQHSFNRKPPVGRINLGPDQWFGLTHGEKTTEDLMDMSIIYRNGHSIDSGEALFRALMDYYNVKPTDPLPPTSKPHNVKSLARAKVKVLDRVYYNLYMRDKENKRRPGWFKHMHYQLGVLFWVFETNEDQIEGQGYYYFYNTDRIGDGQSRSWSGDNALKAMCLLRARWQASQNRRFEERKTLDAPGNELLRQSEKRWLKWDEPNANLLRYDD